MVVPHLPLRVLVAVGSVPRLPQVPYPSAGLFSSPRCPPCCARSIFPSLMASSSPCFGTGPGVQGSCGRPTPGAAAGQVHALRSHKPTLITKAGGIQRYQRPSAPRGAPRSGGSGPQTFPWQRTALPPAPGPECPRPAAWRAGRAPAGRSPRGTAPLGAGRDRPGSPYKGGGGGGGGVALPPPARPPEPPLPAAAMGRPPPLRLLLAILILRSAAGAEARRAREPGWGVAGWEASA